MTIDQEVLRCPDCRHHVDEPGKRCLCDSWDEIWYYYISTGQYHIFPIRNGGTISMPIDTMIHPCTIHLEKLESE